jgi:hypothetical protein
VVPSRIVLSFLYYNQGDPREEKKEPAEKYLPATLSKKDGEPYIK